LYACPEFDGFAEKAQAPLAYRDVRYPAGARHLADGLNGEVEQGRHVGGAKGRHAASISSSSRATASASVRPQPNGPYSSWPSIQAHQSRPR
jgi:hypothetical protein